VGNQIGSGAQSAFVRWVLGTFLAQHLQLVPRLRMSGAITPLLNAPSRSARTFTFYLYIRLSKTWKCRVSSIISGKWCENSNTTFGLHVVHSFEPVGWATKVKLSLNLIKYHDMKRYWDSGGITPRTINFATKWKWVISFRPRPLYPRWQRRRYQVDNRSGRPHSLHWSVEKHNKVTKLATG